MNGWMSPGLGGSEKLKPLSPESLKAAESFTRKPTKACSKKHETL